MYHFPMNLKTQKKWLSLICRKDKVNTKNARVCAEHFTRDDFQRDELIASLNLGEVLLNKIKVDALPSQNLPRSRKETAVGLARPFHAQKRNVKAQTVSPLYMLNQKSSRTLQQVSLSQTLRGQ